VSDSRGFEERRHNRGESDWAESGRARLVLLAEVSRRLAESLDYETTLASVASMSLSKLGGWCIVDLLDADGTIRRLAVVHPDPDKRDAARALQEQHAPRPGDNSAAARVMRTGRVERARDVSEETLSSQTQNAGHLALLRTLGVRDFVVAPMIARGVVLGAITFISSQDDDAIDDDDVILAEDLASRAAMAIENARLHLAASSSNLARAAAVTRAEEAGRRKSEFLATMSHEFRTPLNAILGYAQILGMGLLGPTTAAQHSHLERLQASARHLLQLVDDVLDVAKVDANRLALRPESLMTGASIAAVVSLVHPQATAKGIRLVDLDAMSAGIAYVGDEGRVRQILVNLLSNAVKFTPPGGEVTVTCGATTEPDPGARLGDSAPEIVEAGAAPTQSSWAFIRVRDTGPGISPEFMSQLFEPFAQADSALTRAKGGTGLGLAISRGLARRMGGDITVRSRKDAGATFTLWLPTPRDAPPPTKMESVAEGPGRLTAASSAAIMRADAANLDDAAYAVLNAIGTRLAVDAEIISQRYVEALRADDRFPGVKELRAAQLRDHATPFVGLLATQLIVLGETLGEDPDLLADGGHLQRLMAELHGAQRHRLGWGEADIERESHVLFKEVERAIHAAIDTTVTERATAADAGRTETVSTESIRAATKYAIDVAFRVLGKASHTTIRSFRFAQEADAP
jgi:signal transduction histidine kinase